MSQKFINWDNLAYILEQLQKRLVSHVDLDEHMDVFWDAREKVTNKIKYGADEDQDGNPCYQESDYNDPQKTPYKSIVGVNKHNLTQDVLLRDHGDLLKDLVSWDEGKNQELANIKYAADKDPSGVSYQAKGSNGVSYQESDYNDPQKTPYKSIVGVNQELKALRGELEDLKKNIENIPSVDNQEILRISQTITNIESCLTTITSYTPYDEDYISGNMYVVKLVNDSYEPISGVNVIISLVNESGQQQNIARMTNILGEAYFDISCSHNNVTFRVDSELYESKIWDADQKLNHLIILPYSDVCGEDCDSGCDGCGEDCCDCPGEDCDRDCDCNDCPGEDCDGCVEDCDDDY